MEKFIDENGKLDVKAYAAWLEEQKEQKDCIIKSNLECEVKKMNEETFEFIASTDSVDRSGEVISVDGWDTKSYNKTNGVVLADHKNSIQSIVGAGKARIEDKNLILRVKFATDVEENDLARFTRSMVEKGYINAVSVGFRPLEWKVEQRKHDDGEKRDTLIFTKQELYEVSMVAVPANRDAVRKGIMTGAISGKDVEIAKRVFGDMEIKDENEEQKKLLAVLRDNHEITKKYRKSFEQIRKLIGIDPQEDESATIEKAMDTLLVVLADFQPKKVATQPEKSMTNSRTEKVDAKELGASLRKLIS